ncbi:hypothetical protein DL768_008456 [Monosporascus sp. mg162]|nr:hypothetical protein DL768_008456 [Monosporascus sp. mg162]
MASFRQVWQWLRTATEDGDGDAGAAVVEEVVLPPRPSHPYYPEDVSIPGYAPNELPVPVLMAALGGMLSFALLGSSIVALRVNPALTRSNLAVFCWFMLCGCLHCFFEGYFVLNHATVASSQSLPAQLWKEYALSDSRYLTSDLFMLCVESITALLWGPLCFLCALTTALPRSPLRHPLRIVACMAHLYGVALYYATSLCELHYGGRSHSRPEPLYFWGYYVGFNLPWVVVPALILADSFATLTRALRALDRVDGALDGFWSREGRPTTGGDEEEPKKTK